MNTDFKDALGRCAHLFSHTEICEKSVSQLHTYSKVQRFLGNLDVATSSWQRLIAPKFILHHDNKPKHTARVTTNCRQLPEQMLTVSHLFQDLCSMKS